MELSEWILPFCFAFGTGILSAWGIGGGTLLLLCMTLFLGVEQNVAQGINLLYFLPTAGVSLFFYRKEGYLEAQTLRAAITLGTLCAAVAAVVATAIDISLLRKPFGVFLAYAGISMLLQA